VLAGADADADGRDASREVGAQLSGVSDEAARAMRHLDLGAWTSLVFETDAASVALAPVGDTLLVVAADRRVPLGFVRRLLCLADARARQWLEGHS
jgi:predicted regulator of Ras-like GTPase activity (Roadblock/LC7/MglB family)